MDNTGLPKKYVRIALLENVESYFELMPNEDFELAAQMIYREANELTLFQDLRLPVRLFYDSTKLFGYGYHSDNPYLAMMKTLCLMNEDGLNILQKLFILRSLKGFFGVLMGKTDLGRNAAEVLTLEIERHEQVWSDIKNENTQITTAPISPLVSEPTPVPNSLPVSVEEASPTEKPEQAAPVKTVPALALMYVYLEKIRYFAGMSSRSKIMNEEAPRHGVSPNALYNNFNYYQKDENRLTDTAIPHIKKAIELLVDEDYTSAAVYAEADLQTIKTLLKA